MKCTTELFFNSRSLRLAEGDIYCEAAYEAPLLLAALGAAYKSAGVLFCSATLQRAKVYEYQLGIMAASYAASDTAVQWDLSRFSSTAALVASASAPNLLDPGDRVAATSFSNNVTTELTYTATAGAGAALQSIALNQRGSYRWRALDDGDNIIVPNVAANGIGLRAQTGASFGSTAVGTIAFTE